MCGLGSGPGDGRNQLYGLSPPVPHLPSPGSSLAPNLPSSPALVREQPPHHLWVIFQFLEEAGALNFSSLP